MKFLIDNALSPLLVDGVVADGHDAVHVRDLGLAAASDEAVFDRAARDARVLVSADTDSGTILAHRNATSPSVILFRHGAERHPDRQVRLLAVNLPDLEQALREGSIVNIEPSRIRVRSLPLS